MYNHGFRRKENVIDTATEEVDGIVEQVRSLPEVRNEYMTLGDIIDYERKEAADEATEKANKQTLINCICAYFKKQGEVPARLERELETIGSVDKLQLLYEKAMETKNVADFIGQINN